MFPDPHGNGVRPPSHSGLGVGVSSNVITAPASCGTTPTNAADLCSCVVPVLAAAGRVQPAARAAAAAVPPVVSWLNPTSNVSARPRSSTCSQPGSARATGAPAASVIRSIGDGGHQRPLLASVAPTLANSSALVGVTPRVN